MRPNLSPSMLAGLCLDARNEPLSVALLTLGRAATGIAGFLACNGFVVHDGTDEKPILEGEGIIIERTRLVDCPDRVVNYLGLRIGRISALPPDEFTVSLAVLAVRLGLLSRILDLAYDHLKNRVSFGQKTLKHQLVKATFADVHGAIVNLTEQACLRVERAFAVGLVDDHVRVTELSCKAEKLMGGHGYLLTGTHSISYLSMLLFSIYAARR